MKTVSRRLDILQNRQKNVGQNSIPAILSNVNRLNARRSLTFVTTARAPHLRAKAQRFITEAYSLNKALPTPVFPF